MEEETLMIDSAVVVDGVVDFKNRPASRSASGGWRSAAFIIGAYGSDIQTNSTVFASFLFLINFFFFFFGVKALRSRSVSRVTGSAGT